ncbi:MAG: MFS transporter, partial [Alphaproteobacteria bacterium]|nr:MFS transporter [Alphaproteobacteria bacterium]
MFSSLLKSRRFAPLFWTQFLSAFNDNFVRNMLAMLILFQLGEANSGLLITLAVAIFILPSIFISALGGEIADANDKALIAQRLKFAEIFVQAVAAAGFWFVSIPLLYAALFGLGAIAALFGPIKYGILPDHLETRELPAGNALVEGATFLAILFGLIAGGYAASGAAPAWLIAIALMIIAAACWLASRYIPATGIAAPQLKPRANIFASTGAMLGELRASNKLWIGAFAVGWFWMVGAIALSLVPVIIKERTGGGIEVTTTINALFAIGIAVGSLLAAIIAHGRISLLPVPVAAVLMGLFLIDLGFATAGMPTKAA